MKNELLEQALKYAKAGYKVIPLFWIKADGSCACNAGMLCGCKGKHPRIMDWVNQATTDVAIINRWWSDTPIANIGIKTGKDTGVFVLDEDDGGDKTIEELQMINGPLPKTPTSISGSGGMHRIFKYPQGKELKNKTRFAPGLDIRSDGGQFVAAPSIHASGKQYKWVEGMSIFDIEPAEAPEWLIKMIESVSVKKPSYKELPYEPFDKGTRNMALTSLAGTMRAKGMGFEAILAALLAENKARCNPPLNEEEVKVIAFSIAKYEPSSKIISLIPYELNDVGNAKRLIALFGDNIRFCPEWNVWLYYSDGYWQKDIEGNVYAMARVILAQLGIEVKQLEDNMSLLKFVSRSGNHSRIAAMLDQAKTFTENDIPVVAERWDSKHHLLCTKNVTIDFLLKEKNAFPKIRGHSREDFITKQLSFSYDGTAECPTWNSFLIDIIPDEQTRLFVQRAVGYTLTGLTSEDMLFILYGTGSNGKSTFVETLGEMLGRYSKTIKPETLIVNDKSNTIKTEIAAICGARFVRTSEIDEGKRLSESLVKQLTGGDTVSTRFLFGKDFEYEPTYKIWISTNHKPKIYGNDDGIWRRICLIPFMVKIEGEKKDKFLDLKLKKELPGILNWALKGLVEWKKQGLNPPPEVQNATLEYRKDEDVLQGFIEDCLEKAQNHSISASELYDFYKLYCEQNGTVLLTSTTFGKKMSTDKGFEKTKSMGKMFYVGVKIKEKVMESLKNNEFNNENTGFLENKGGEWLEITNDKELPF